MHVAVIGAGALGRTYGVHLSAAGVNVSYVVRPSRINETGDFVVARMNRDKRTLEAVSPRRYTRVPEDADVVLLAVRSEQVDAALESVLSEAPPVPVVLLTPFLPQSEAHIAGVLGGPCVVALPTVAARLEKGRVECYLPPFSKTLFESGAGRPREVEELVAALNGAGLPAGFSNGVRLRNPATTIAFFPLTVGLSAAGSMDALLANPELCTLTLASVRDAVRLGRRVGPVGLPLSVALATCTRVILRVAVAMARFVAPALADLLEQHFATKLVAQHRVLGREILELGRQYGAEQHRLGELLRRLPA
jgi:ketopantoate reductase